MLCNSCGIIYSIGYLNWLKNADLTDSASYQLDDVSIRLVKRLPNDSLHLTRYESTYELPGNVYPKLQSIDYWEPDSMTGIQIKLWAKIVTENGRTFYGQEPRLGLDGQIQQIDIKLVEDSYSILLNPSLKGDSSIHKVKWQSLKYKKTPYTWGDIPYLRDIESMKSKLNHKPNILGSIQDHDYIFWINSDIEQQEPDSLTVEIQIKDSTGKEYFLRDGIALYLHQN